MNGAMMTCELDTNSLRQLTGEIFPQLLAAGRRTLEEQSVTSSTFIAFRAQKLTPFVETATIDSELDVDVTPIRKGTRTATQRFKSQLAPLPWTRGMMIALQRTNPNSPYSLSTGNRWPLAYPGGLRGQYRWRFFEEAAERMKMSRHSSTHFLQTGWTPAIRTGVASPYYRYNASFGSRRDAAAIPNSGVGDLKSGDVEQLGTMTIDLLGDECVVTTSNDIGGEGTNDVLLEKYRAALIEHGTRPLEEAIEMEVADGEKELKIRFLMETQKLSRPMVMMMYFPK